MATLYKLLKAQDNLIVDLWRTIEMLSCHIGLPSPQGSQNASKNQQEESEGARDGDGGGDLSLD